MTERQDGTLSWRGESPYRLEDGRWYCDGKAEYMAMAALGRVADLAWQLARYHPNPDLIAALEAAGMDTKTGRWRDG